MDIHYSNYLLKRAVLTFLTLGLVVTSGFSQEEQRPEFERRDLVSYEVVTNAQISKQIATPNKNRFRIIKLDERISVVNIMGHPEHQIIIDDPENSYTIVEQKALVDFIVDRLDDYLGGGGGSSSTTCETTTTTKVTTKNGETTTETTTKTTCKTTQ